uniref:Uncharacterized protein n=1 Tax=Strigamia maritima TaxID=126957 RepID=T1JDC8_STRMM
MRKERVGTKNEIARFLIKSRNNKNLVQEIANCLITASNFVQVFYQIGNLFKNLKLFFVFDVFSCVNSVSYDNTASNL